MIRPRSFGYNPETASTNVFQKKILISPSQIRKLAKNEFADSVRILKSKNISVHVFDELVEMSTPDAVFPNNWFSVQRQILFIYPMFSLNRRREKRKDIIDYTRNHCSVKEIVDLSHYEKENKFLEGTGSLVFDHLNKIGYANLSSRTDREPAFEVCSKIKYELVLFSAADQSGNEIYHTNVLMSIGADYAIVCLDAIPDTRERKKVEESLSSSGKELIIISPEQMVRFCGNCIELQGSDQKKFIVMSESARKGFAKNQLASLEKFANIVSLPIPTIETVGGGSARCMIAELFNPDLQ